jgi:hypothetical protein
MSNIPNNFNWKDYLKLNPDLNQFVNQEEAIHHYIHHGLKENRPYKVSIPNDFNWKVYIKLNKDLNQNCNENEVVYHYLNYGVFEGRQYKVEIPNDFEWRVYLKINKDLNENCTEDDVNYHYLNYGFFEGRTYKVNLPNDFVWEIYVLINDDFPKDWGQKEAIYHYMNYGFFESFRSYKINTKKKIYHITHNFGGGTHVYIENISKIFTNYNHIVVNIIDKDRIIIDNNKRDNNFLKNIINSEDIIIVHHLLYYDEFYMCNKISKEIANIITSTNAIKIFIVHDYFLLNPSTPNPIKSENIIICQETIEESKIFLSCFNKIFFNSVNCYNNHLKNLYSINNASILNIVPDISYYNNRIFPVRKEKYNIGIIGSISCPHKGILIAGKIIDIVNNNYENKYNFLILGDSYLEKKNLRVTGKYDNNNIFSMINENDIDYFLFLSAFEETYSFTLSIAIHTGVPIIYNNIGAYTERLNNYNNCFPFIEDNCEDILNILNNLDYNNDLIRSEKKISLSYPNLYNNIPEFSNFLKIDDYLNFNVSDIDKNLHHGAVCFIHVCNIDVHGEAKGISIFNDQIDYIKKTGLYDKLDYIFVTLLGKNVLLTHDYKIKVIYYSENQNEMEFPSIQRIKYFADNISKKIKILYIHTKGVTNKDHSYEWRKYLEYFLIEKNSLCLNALENYKCVGVNHQYYYDESKYRNHFSGNFWWATSDYIKTLPMLQIGEDRYAVEHWLIGHLEINDYRYFLSLHHTNINFYETHLNREKYNLEIIKSTICENVKTNYVKNRKIIGVYFICCVGNYLEIVNNHLNKLIDTGLYHASDEILCFICLETDECINLLKNFEKIRIISTKENLYEKFAINNFKNYISGDYYLYYMHSKSVTREEQCYNDWLYLCDYFTIQKWKISIELLNYYDCVGTNLKLFPKKHFSGNFWWSKSEHINTLPNITDGYLSSEMYICSNMKTNYVSIYQSYVNHGDTNFPMSIYQGLSDADLVNNYCIIPDFNNGDKHCIKYCGDIQPNFEPAIIELE